MTTSLRSRVEFLRKLEEFELGDHKKIITEDHPAGLGLYSMQRMAAFCGANPEKIEQSVIEENLEKPLLQLGLPQGKALDVRSLYWECVFAVGADYRQRFSVNKDEALLPFNDRERGERRVALRGVLRKVLPSVFTGQLDPAHCIEDDLHDYLMADRLLYYVGPQACPTRADELKATLPRAFRGVKAASAQNEVLKQLASLMAPIQQPIKADVSTAHLLDYALMRRGLAFETVGLLPWSAHELWRNMLMGALHLEPVREGYAPPDLTDVLCADKAVWEHLVRLSTGGIRPNVVKHVVQHVETTEQIFPLEAALRKALEENEVKNYLLCQPARAAAPAAKKARTATPAGKGQDDGSSADEAPKPSKGQVKRARVKAEKRELAYLRSLHGKGVARVRRPPPCLPCHGSLRPQLLWLLVVWCLRRFCPWAGLPPLVVGGRALATTWVRAHTRTFSLGSSALVVCTSAAMRVVRRLIR